MLSHFKILRECIQQKVHSSDSTEGKKKKNHLRSSYRSKTMQKTQKDEFFFFASLPASETWANHRAWRNAFWILQISPPRAPNPHQKPRLLKQIGGDRAPNASFQLRHRIRTRYRSKPASINSSAHCEQKSNWGFRKKNEKEQREEKKTEKRGKIKLSSPPIFPPSLSIWWRIFFNLLTEFRS